MGLKTGRRRVVLVNINDIDIKIFESHDEAAGIVSSSGVYSIVVRVVIARGYFGLFFISESFKLIRFFKLNTF